MTDALPNHDVEASSGPVPEGVVAAGKQSRADREAENRRLVSEHLKRANGKGRGLTVQDVNRLRSWPSGAGAVLRSLARRGEAHERDGLWHPGPGEGRPSFAPQPRKATPPPEVDVDALVREEIRSQRGASITPTALAMLVRTPAVTHEQVVAAIERLVEAGELERASGRVRVPRPTADIQIPRPQARPAPKAPTPGDGPGTESAPSPAVNASSPRAAVATLSPGRRAVVDVVLAHPSGIAPRDVAAELGITPRAAGDRLVRALKAGAPIRATGQRSSRRYRPRLTRRSPRRDQVVQVVERHPDGISPSDVAAEIGTTLSTASSALRSALKAGLLLAAGRTSSRRYYPIDSVALSPSSPEAGNTPGAPAEGGGAPDLQEREARAGQCNEAPGGAAPDASPSDGDVEGTPKTKGRDDGARARRPRGGGTPPPPTPVEDASDGTGRRAPSDAQGAPTLSNTARAAYDAILAGPGTQRELAERAGLPKGTFGNQIRRLRELGLIATDLPYRPVGAAQAPAQAADGVVEAVPPELTSTRPDRVDSGGDTPLDPASRAAELFGELNRAQVLLDLQQGEIAELTTRLEEARAANTPAPEPSYVQGLEDDLEYFQDVVAAAHDALDRLGVPGEPGDLPCRLSWLEGHLAQGAP